MDDIYLDHNATTPLDPRVKEAWLSAAVEFGNPSSIYERGRRAKQRVWESRRQIAQSCGVKDEEIVFTSGGTESMQLLLRGILESKRGGHVLSSNVEHAATLQVLESYRPSLDIELLSPGFYGAVTREMLEKHLKSSTLLVTLMAVNNETGVKTDLSEIAALCEEKKIPLIVDGVAALGKEPLVLPSGILGMGFSGHKTHAPQGTGFLIIRNKRALVPFFAGGGQEFGLRGGTENVPGIAALGVAVALAAKEEKTAIARMTAMRDLFLDRLQKGLSGVHVNGDGPKVSNTLNLYFEGIEGEELLMALDLRAVAASHGSACSTGALEPSRVLLAMGYPMERVRGSLRFSLSRMTTEAEMEKAADIVIQEVKKLRNFFELQ